MYKTARIDINIDLSNTVLFWVLILEGAYPTTFNESLFFLISGIVIGVPVALFFEVYASRLFSFVGLAVLIAPFVEEFAKSNALFYRHDEPSRHLMSIGFIAGFGFGLAEFLGYVAAGVPVIYRLPGVLFHPASTSIIGYGVGKHMAWPFFLLAVFLHALSNMFAVYSSNIFWVLGGQMIVLIVSYAVVSYMYSKK